MPTPRRSYSAEYKAKIALEALKGQRPLNELAAEPGIHPHQIGQWRSQLLTAIPGIFPERGAVASLLARIVKAARSPRAIPPPVPAGAAAGTGARVARRGIPPAVWLLGSYGLAAGLLLLAIGDHPPFPYNWEPATGRGLLAFWAHPGLAIFQAREGLMTDSGDSPLLVLPAWLAWQVLGVNLTALRVPAALIAAAAVPLLWPVGRRLVGPRAAALAVGLLALSPVFLFYGRTATLVGLSLTPALLTIDVLLRALARPHAWRWILAVPALLVVDAYAYAPIRFLWPLSLLLLAWTLHDHPAARPRLRPALVLAGGLVFLLLPWIEQDSGGTLGMALLYYYDGRGEQVFTQTLYQPPAADLQAAAAGRVGRPQLTVAQAATQIGQNTLDYGQLLLDWDTRPLLTDYWNPHGRLYPAVLVPFFLLGLWRTARAARRQAPARRLLVLFLGLSLPLLLTSQVHSGRLIFAVPLLLLLVASGFWAVARAGAGWVAAHAAAGAGGRLERGLGGGGAAVLLVVVATTTWQEYRVTPPPPPEEAVVPLLRAGASGPAAGAALVMGDPAAGDQVALERVTVGGYQLELQDRYRFVDLAAGPDAGPAPGDRRPPLYYGAILDRLAQPDTLPGGCSLHYYVAAAQAAAFTQVAAPWRDHCGAPLAYQVWPR